MDNLERLNAITKQVNPVSSTPAAKEPLFSPKIVKLLIIGGIAIVLLLVVSLFTGGKEANDSDYIAQINLRYSNLYTNVDEYNGYIKSSKLRGAGVTLSSILSGSTTQLSSILKDTYEYDDDMIPSSILASETELNNSLSEALLDGKINGNLDRVYAREITYQLDILLPFEEKVLSKIKDEKVKDIITNSHNNLSNIYNEFTNHTSTK